MSNGKRNTLSKLRVGKGHKEGSQKSEYERARESFSRRLQLIVSSVRIPTSLRLKR